jgi:hypothetical protein
VAGDINNDGCDEFLIGFPYETATYQNAICAVQGGAGIRWTLGLSAPPDGLVLADENQDGVLELLVNTQDGWLLQYH